jgi:NTE family protein
MQRLGAASKLNADWDFLIDLYTIGRKKADAWLRDDFSKVGIKSSIDIRDKYL